MSGSVTGAVATLGVNGKSRKFTVRDLCHNGGAGVARWEQSVCHGGEQCGGALVVSTITSNRLPVTVSFGYDLNGNLVSDGQGLTVMTRRTS